VRIASVSSIAAPLSSVFDPVAQPNHG